MGDRHSHWPHHDEHFTMQMNTKTPWYMPIVYNCVRVHLCEIGSCYVAKAGLKLTNIDQAGPMLTVILLPQSQKS